MLFKKTKEVKQLDIKQQEITSLIGYGYEVKGDIVGDSIIRIDGKVDGHVLVKQGLILGEKGSITGDVKTESAIIYGKVKGNITASQLEIKKTGTVQGDIHTETLEIELGAQYNGKLEMKQLIKKQQSDETKNIALTAALTQD